MNRCEYVLEDCTRDRDNCFRCIDGNLYIAPKIKQSGLKKGPNIKSKRQGSRNEVITYNQTKDALNITGTPNSGAGHIKGDFQIGSMAMIECKTTTKKNEGRQPGKESFSIKREHLDKLEREAKEAGMEFYYLVFSFKEEDEKLYVVSNIEQYNSMLATMKHDRTELKKSQNIIDVHKTRTALVSAENTKLLAEVEHLKAKLEYYENKDKDILF